MNDLTVLGIRCSGDEATDASPLDLYHHIVFDEAIDGNFHSPHGPLKMWLALAGGS